jgi:transcriptional regulator with GAF, ATPase, and Fis domain
MTVTREQRVAATFVELADTLVDDFDVIDFLQTLALRCTELLTVDAAGIMLADANGALQVAASSVDEARVVELYELQNAEGPCLDCFRTGAPVVNVVEPAQRWPRFSARAAAVGFTSTHALPLQLRGQVIGTLNLFLATSRELDEATVHLGQALADVATIALIQQRSRHEAEILTHQLQTALTSRIVVEQAKGILAANHGITPDAAFAILRRRARSDQIRLAELAERVIQNPDRLMFDD